MLSVFGEAIISLRGGNWVGSRESVRNVKKTKQNVAKNGRTKKENLRINARKTLSRYKHGEADGKGSGVEFKRLPKF